MFVISSNQTPAQTRSFLRDQLARGLRKHSGVGPGSDKVPLQDESMLQLLQSLQIAYDSEVQRARKTYNENKKPGEPRFGKVISDGWFDVSWGRISAPVGRGLGLRKREDGAPTALGLLLSSWYNEHYTFSPEVRGDPRLADIVSDIEDGRIPPQHVPCMTPKWVAARLWDRRPKSGDDISDLRSWYDRWLILGFPELVAFHAWLPEDAAEFRAAAHDVLSKAAKLKRWSEIRDHMIRRFALEHGRKFRSKDSYFLPIPETLIDRALWLNDNRVERFAHHLSDGAAQGLARLLWAEIAARDFGPGPLPESVALLEGACEYPEMLNSLWWRVQQNPQLLADMALYGPTAALACLWVAKWRIGPNGWDRELTDVEDKIGKEKAFMALVSVLGRQLQLEAAPPAEAGALLGYFHTHAQRGYVDDPANADPSLASLREMIAGQTQDVIVAMTHSLLTEANGEGFIGSHLATILDLVSLGNIETRIDAKKIVNGYIACLLSGDFRIATHRLGAQQAAALYRLAARPEADEHAFLYPPKFRPRRPRFRGEFINPWNRADDEGRSVRTHIRVLARAIVGLSDQPGENLAAALVAAIREGSKTDNVTGQVRAFAPRYESTGPWQSPDRPLAADIAAALRHISQADQQAVVSALCAANEPLILAQLFNLVDLHHKHALQHRLENLPPAVAAAIMQLPEAQARIDALLAAGLADVAARYIDAEEGLETLGKLPGRNDSRLRARLTLLYLNKAWDEILAMEIPAVRPPMVGGSQYEIVMFFKAITLLSKPDGDAATAAEILRQLCQFNRSAPFASNLFAAELAALLANKPYDLLVGSQARAGRELLADLNRRTGDEIPTGSAEQESIASNKALLLLALGEPDKALTLLSGIDPNHNFDRVAGYGAVALSRLGRTAEAKAAIADAEALHGSSHILELTKSFLGFPTAGSAVTDAASDDADHATLKNFWVDLANLEPSAQAKIMLSGGAGLEGLQDVREASASILNLVPSSRIGRNEHEDDTTDILRELLQQRYRPPRNWMVLDQSRGGFSGKGRVGERDLTIKRGPVTLSIIECVVCRDPIHRETSKDNLDAHFEKLFGYGTCRFFFHLTYAYDNDIAAILAHLEETLRSPPAGFAYTEHKSIPFEDSGPLGFIARYRGPVGNVTVCFLVLDLSQSVQLAAAKAAAAPGQRRRRKTT